MLGNPPKSHEKSLSSGFSPGSPALQYVPSCCSDSPFYRWENRGLYSLRNLLKATWLGSGRAGTEFGPSALRLWLTSCLLSPLSWGLGSHSWGVRAEDRGWGLRQSLEPGRGQRGGSAPSACNEAACLQLSGGPQGVQGPVQCPRSSVPPSVLQS